MNISDRVKLKRETHFEHGEQIKKGASGVLLSINNVFVEILLDKQYQKNNITTIVMFNDEIEKE